MRKLIVFSLLFLVVSASPVFAADTSDEEAINKLNHGLLPPEVNQNAEKVDNGDYKVLKNEPLNTILSFLANLFGNQFASFVPSAIDNLSPKAAIQQHAEVPDDLRPKDKDTQTIFIPVLGIPIDIPVGLLKRTSKNLGHKESFGTYQEALPESVQVNAEKSREFESLYEQANFPPGIKPITGP